MSMASRMRSSFKDGAPASAPALPPGGSGVQTYTMAGDTVYAVCEGCGAQRALASGHTGRAVASDPESRDRCAAGAGFAAGLCRPCRKKTFTKSLTLASR